MKAAQSGTRTTDRECQSEEKGETFKTQITPPSLSLSYTSGTFRGKPSGGESGRLMRTVTPGALVHNIGSLLTAKQVATEGGNDPSHKASRNPDRSQRHKCAISRKPVLLLVATRVTGQSDMIKSVLHFFLFDPVCAKKKKKNPSSNKMTFVMS